MGNSFLSHSDAAMRNRNSILRFVKEHAPVSRTDIWENMQMSRASVTQVIRQLQENRLIMETGEEGESTGGRKPRYIVFQGASRKFYAFDWVSRTLLLMDLDKKVLYEDELVFECGVSPGVFSKKIKEAVHRIDSMNLCSREEISGICLALPGQIDSRTGSVICSVELGWQNVSLCELFVDRFGSNVYLERSSNLMALGEYSQNRTDKSTHFQLCILSDDGIGVSTIIHGNCQHGSNYMHGELGHIKVPSDIVCSCGQKGCLEAVVNKLLEESAGEFTDEIINYLAIGISSSVNIFDVDSMLVVGSYPIRMSEDQREMLKERIYEKVSSQHMRKLSVHYGFRTKELSLLGIGEYMFEKIFPI